MRRSEHGWLNLVCFEAEEGHTQMAGCCGCQCPCHRIAMPPMVRQIARQCTETHPFQAVAS